MFRVIKQKIGMSLVVGVEGPEWEDTGQRYLDKKRLKQVLPD